MAMDTVFPTGLLGYDRELESLRFELSDTQQQLDVATTIAARVIDSAAEGILITDANTVIRSVNPAFEKATGFKAEEAIGRTPAILQSGHHSLDFYRDMWRTLNTFGHWRGEVWNRHKNGEIYSEWLSITAVRDRQQRVSHYVGIFSDAHIQEYLLERLHYLAYYDGLTGLPNRRLFLDRLNMSISHARREKHMMAVMFIDLDQFKQINDTLGHKIGDGLLIGVTERMKGYLRDEDTLARLAGDEFTVILPDIPNADAASNVARKFLECYARPLNIEGHELCVTASIGIGIYPHDGEDVESLLHHADIAMYRIKGSGRNGFLRYAPGMAKPTLDNAEHRRKQD